MSKTDCPNGMKKIDEIDACWEPDLSVTGNPMGRFYNGKGEIIAYSSYDYISRITEFANEKQREYFTKYLR